MMPRDVMKLIFAVSYVSRTMNLIIQRGPKNGTFFYARLNFIKY